MANATGQVGRAVERVVLFDGVCNLCNAAVRFIVKRDPHGAIHFAALDSDDARRRLAAAGAPPDLPDSLILIDEAGVHVRSEAALRVAARLRWPWSVLRFARILPRPIRDAVYAWIARHRYRWFGRRASCMVPTDDLRSRFIDQD